MDQALADEFRERMERLQMTQEDLAAAVGQSQSYISHLLGPKSNPQLKTLEPIADALGCKLQLVPRR